MTHKNGISAFLERHFCHFNAREVLRAAQAYQALLKQDGKMFLTLAGAMSTARLGRSLAEMIRQEKVHAICCTGANLEEDIFRLVADENYVDIESWRDLTPEDESQLLEQRLCRVTDTCIPEEKAMLVVEKEMRLLWKEAAEKGESFFPYEYFYQLIRKKRLESFYSMDPKDSWLVAACEKDLPLFVPGWEDSTLGNAFVGAYLRGDLSTLSVVKSGLEAMVSLAKWYEEISRKYPVGFFQIGGGIAGDFPICVVPLLNIDLKKDVPLWAYFCQIGDSTTSYGSYSGAVPNEKITWGKLGPDTPRFMIESDATIVAPLIFAYVLGW